jgi:hypothetical protein
MHRRQLLHAATLAAAAPLAVTTARAQVATPASSDDAPTLSARVTAIDPEVMLEALLSTPVTTPLVPRDTPDVEPVPWEDESDLDLDGAVGGVLFQTGWDANDNPLVMATAIVLPDADAAAASIADVNPDEIQVLYGLPFFAQDFGDYAVAVVRVGYLLLAGGAEAPEEAPPIAHGGAAGATPASESPAGTSGRYHLRAVGNLAATLDHLEDVLAVLDA